MSDATPDDPASQPPGGPPPPPPPGGSVPPLGGAPTPPPAEPAPPAAPPAPPAPAAAPGGLPPAPGAGAPPPPGAGAPPAPGSVPPPPGAVPPPPGFGAPAAPGSVPPPPGFGSPGSVPPPGGFTPGAPLGATSGSGSNGMAVASLVVGIISLIGIFCWGVGGLVLGLVAVVLGVLGMKKAKELPGQPQKGLAIGGIVTGAIGLLGGLLFLVLTVVLVSTADQIETDFGDINSDPADGVCDESRFLQDPDC